MIRWFYSLKELENRSTKFGIILNPSGPVFGGAQKRFTNLFQHLYFRYPENVFYFISRELHSQIHEIFPSFNFANIVVLNDLEFNFFSSSGNNSTGIKFKEWIIRRDTGNKQLNSKNSILRQIFKYLKFFIKQYYLYRQIEKIRKKNNINVFLGVFNGILPLYFYLNKSKRNTGIIFSDMDSWFSNIYNGDMYSWNLKYDSFNYGLEKSDFVDFLSPYIADGVLERKIRVNKKTISITPCSFSDYSKCIPGNKKEFIVSYAARIFPDKNPMLYLEAAKIIVKKYPFVKFNLMGTGLPGLQSEILEFIEINELRKNVIFNFHPNPPEVFSESTVFVSIQSTNNYPSQSVLEAMACGNAVIASDVGDTRMFVNEDVGILIPLDLISVVNAIELLINDREYALRLGKNAREFVIKNHTIERCADYYLSLIEKARIKIESEFSN